MNDLTFTTLMSKYNGEGYMLLLFAAAFIYIVIDNNTAKKYFMLYTIAIFITALNPLVILFFGRYEFVVEPYYRMMWTLPVGIIIAYAGTRITTRYDKTVTKTIAFVVCAAIIGFAGVFMQGEEFTYSENSYKIPDEIIRITDVIHNDGIEDATVLFPIDLVEYTRQYDASLKNTYGRGSLRGEPVPTGTKYNDAVRLILDRLRNRGDIDISAFEDALKATSTDYIVIDKNHSLNDEFYLIDCYPIADVGKYLIYRYDGAH